MTGPILASPRYLLSETGMREFDKLCARMPIVDYQRQFVETGARPTKQDQATAEYVLAKKETPQVDLIGTEVALLLG